MKDDDGALRELPPLGPLTGEIRVPGDKSISHRAVIFSALARGTSRVSGLSGGEDVSRTLHAFERMGVGVVREGADVRIEGNGLRGLKEPDDILYCGNSGTTTRLLMGILAGQPFFSGLTGDESLRGRPMARVAGPLRSLGATIIGRMGGDRLPLGIVGGNLQGGNFEIPVASAQIKSALMLAGLYADRPVTVQEPADSRDHTERAFRCYGLPIERVGRAITVGPGQDYASRDVVVPGDISAAAFFLVAASIVPGSDLTIRNVGINPGRAGVVEALQAMGADITVQSERLEGLEPVADLRVRHAELRGTRLAGELIVRLIDEIPVLSVAALFAEGLTEVRDAGELRVKESDRIRAMATELGRAGFVVEELPDGLRIVGPQRGRSSRAHECYGDHRIAMSLAVMNAALEQVGAIRGAACIDTSFPGFFEVLISTQRLGLAHD